MLVNTLVHPVFSLLIATIGKIAVGLYKIHILVNHVEYLFYACTVESTVAKHLWTPTAIWHWEEVEGITEIGSRHLATIHIIAIALVNHDAIAYLHNSTLNTLQFIACTSHLNEQEEIYHRVTGCFALTNTHGLNKYLIETSGFAQNNRLASLAGHTSQRAS